MRWGEVPCGSDTGRWNVSSSFQLSGFVLFAGCPHPDFPGSLKARISFLLNYSVCRVSFRWNQRENPVFTSLHHLPVHLVDRERKQMNGDEGTSFSN